MPKERVLTSPWFWTEEQLEIVRTRYECTWASAVLLSLRVGKSPAAIKNKAQILGICRGYATLRRWTEKEIELLTENLTRLPVYQVAKKLKRTPSAVASKARRLKLSRRVRDGHYTATEVAEILGVRVPYVLRWIQRGELKAEASSKPKSDGTIVRWIIWEKDIRSFVIDHARSLSGRNVDLLALVFIFTGTVGSSNYD